MRCGGRSSTPRPPKGSMSRMTTWMSALVLAGCIVPANPPPQYGPSSGYAQPDPYEAQPEHAVAPPRSEQAVRSARAPDPYVGQPSRSQPMDPYQRAPDPGQAATEYAQPPDPYAQPR